MNPASMKRRHGCHGSDMRYERYIFILEQLERIGSLEDIATFKMARREDDDDLMWFIANRYPEIETDPYANTRLSERQ